jgi:hypothetical protein
VLTYETRCHRCGGNPTVSSSGANRSSATTRCAASPQSWPCASLRHANLSGCRRPLRLRKCMAALHAVQFRCAASKMYTGMHACMHTTSQCISEYTWTWYKSALHLQQTSMTLKSARSHFSVLLPDRRHSLSMCSHDWSE